jgi:hypothetical protein
MREVDVDRMMARISARQYKEWEAYERATGPLDHTYEREMQAQQHELQQLNNILTGASVTKKGKKNPAGKFRNAYRPEHFTNPYLHVDEVSGEVTEDEEGYIDGIDDEFDDDDGYEEQEEESYESDHLSYDPAQDPFSYMSDNK